MLHYLPCLMQADDRLFKLRTEMRTADELRGSPRMPTYEIFSSHVILRSPLAFYTLYETRKVVTDLSAIK
jgi:hypothetical protein